MEPRFENSPIPKIEQTLPKNQSYLDSHFSVFQLNDENQDDLFVCVVTYPNGSTNNLQKKQIHLKLLLI